MLALEMFRGQPMGDNLLAPRAFAARTTQGILGPLGAHPEYSLAYDAISSAERKRSAMRRRGLRIATETQSAHSLWQKLGACETILSIQVQQSVPQHLAARNV